jgi:ketosteroid isomerase-like protein
MKHVLLKLVVATALILNACNTPTHKVDNSTSKGSAENDASKVEAFIKSEGSKFNEEMQRGDSNALAAHYASNAIVMPPNSGPVEGRNVTAVWGGAVRMGVKGFKLNTSDVTGGGDIYAETGTFEMTGADNKTMDKGKYITVWKKDNGSWKIYRDIWNTSMPMPATK